MSKKYYLVLTNLCTQTPITYYLFWTTYPRNIYSTPVRGYWKLHIRIPEWLFNYLTKFQK